MFDDDRQARLFLDRFVEAARDPSEDPDRTRSRRITLAEAMWGGFYYCPTTRRILAALPGDDKVLCRCRRSNPKVPDERTEQTGVHIIRFLTPATAAAYVDQEGAKEQAS